MNTTVIPVTHNGVYLGIVYIIPESFSLPPLYYASQTFTGKKTELYLTAHEAESALKNQRWSFETRRVAA